MKGDLTPILNQSWHIDKRRLHW